MQIDLTGLYGADLLSALSDSDGNITENVMFEMVMGFSIGREQLEPSPLEYGVSVWNVGNKNTGIY